MKKLITILFLFAFTAQAQFKIAPDKQNHLTAGFMISGTSNALTWKFTERKIVAFGVGVGSAYLAGVMKERYDLKHTGIYSYGDIRATFIGGLIGSSFVSLLTLRCVPKRNLPIDFEFRLDDESTMIKK